MGELTAHTDTHLKAKGRASYRRLTRSRPGVIGFAAALVAAVVVSSATAAGTAAATSVSRSGTPQAAAAAGTLRSWGNNFFGQLGDGSTSSRTTPVMVKLPKGTKVTSVRSGGAHSLALTTTGSVLAWGYNFSGQLGNGTTTDSHTPVRVKLPKGVKVAAVRAGSSHSLALTTTGSVLAWGENTKGALGDGTTTSRSKPVNVKFRSGIKIKAISAGGDNFSLALTTTGQVLAWGNNFYGQLGDGTTTRRSKPVMVKFPRGIKIKTIAGGGEHALAITTGGELFAWGDNFDGQLGDGTTTTSRHVPERIVVRLAGRPAGRITALFAGCYHTVLLTTRLSMVAWGYNADGELGDGTTTSSDTAVRVALLVGFPVKTVSAGCFDTFALTTNGHVEAWGYNADGELGDGTTVSSDNPVIAKLPPGLFAIAIGAGPEAESSLAIVRPR